MLYKHGKKRISHAFAMLSNVNSITATRRPCVFESTVMMTDEMEQCKPNNFHVLCCAKIDLASSSTKHYIQKLSGKNNNRKTYGSEEPGVSIHTNQDPHICHSPKQGTASRCSDSHPSPFSGGHYICSHVHIHCPQVCSDLLHNLSTTCISGQNILQTQKLFIDSIPLYISLF
jgi:hypothetical protein